MQKEEERKRRASQRETTKAQQAVAKEAIQLQKMATWLRDCTQKEARRAAAAARKRQHRLDSLGTINKGNTLKRNSVGSTDQLHVQETSEITHHSHPPRPAFADACSRCNMASPPPPQHPPLTYATSIHPFCDD